MSKLPEKFPEYSIMHKTLSKKIIELEKRKENTLEIDEIELKIQNYQIQVFVWVSIDNPEALSPPLFMTVNVLEKNS